MLRSAAPRSLLAVAVVALAAESFSGSSSSASRRRRRPMSALHQQQQGEDSGEYGGYGTSQVIREFSLYDQLEDIVTLASQPLPERPDGVLVVAKYTSLDEDLRATEASYERLARENPATLFLRCFREMEDAASLFQRASIEVLPTFDLFYKGDRVARVDGPRYNELEKTMDQFQMVNSNLDLFSEDSVKPWGQGGSKTSDFTKTPRTTGRFIPGYDFDKSGGAFDAWADQAQKDSEFDFEESYENDWLPKID